MKWMVVLNAEEKTYIMRRIGGRTEYLGPGGKVNSRPHFYEFYFEAMKDFLKYVPHFLRQEGNVTL